MLNHMVKHNKILKEEKFTSIKDIVEREDTTRKTSSNQRTSQVNQEQVKSSRIKIKIQE